MSVTIDHSNPAATIEHLIAESEQRGKALRKFLKWFDVLEEDIHAAFENSGFSDAVFHNLRDAADAAREALR